MFDIKIMHQHLLTNSHADKSHLKRERFNKENSIFSQQKVSIVQYSHYTSGLLGLMRNLMDTDASFHKIDMIYQEAGMRGWILLPR